MVITGKERSILVPKARIPRWEIQRRRGLSAGETHTTLRKLEGDALLTSQPVVNLLQYTADWEPFVVNKEPKVNQETPGIHTNPLTGEVYLPHSYIKPSRKEGREDQWGNQQFYWDMYFINKALLASGTAENVQLAMNHINNFEYIFDRIGYIPNATGLAILNRAQIPFLSGMVVDVYRTTQDKDWLAEKIEFAKREYQDVWMYTDQDAKSRGIKRPTHRISEESVLIRSVGTDVDKEHYPAAALTGHDDSRQWAGRAYESLPVGLNCALYKYERDFAYTARELGNIQDAVMWEKRAEKRRQEITETFWDERRGMYFDRVYDKRTDSWKLDTTYPSLDTFMPLWVNLATPEQAEKVVGNLPRFLSDYGLFIADKRTNLSERWAKLKTRIAYGLSPKHRRFIPAIDELFSAKQWDYPNIWAPAQYFAVDGLLNYGKTNEAQNVIERMLRAYASFFQKHGTLPEKISGLTGENGGNYQYGDQEGFGWTNAICAIIAGRLRDIIGLRGNERRYATITS